MCQLSALILIAVLGAAADADQRSPAADFRVDNAVFLGKEKTPACLGATIFHGGVVYDFLQNPAETIVFETASGRFILLNPKGRTRTELTVGQLSSFTGHLQALAAKSPEPLVKFLAAPKFVESEDPAAGVLTLSSPLVVYRLTLSPESDRRIVEQYHEFSDWYARLNALLSPGSRPPFGRLVVNAALARRGATAAEVALTIRTGKSNENATTIRSEHRLVRSLDENDFERVDRARKQIVGFKAVRFAEYRQTALR
ncbi:MAG: hypothetical protein JW959_11635 [Pirellulales bacterium]|nr:hypothetical protein [Pirellulales bacterium]